MARQASAMKKAHTHHFQDCKAEALALADRIGISPAVRKLGLQPSQYQRRRAPTQLWRAVMAYPGAGTTAGWCTAKWKQQLGPGALACRTEPYSPHQPRLSAASPRSGEEQLKIAGDSDGRSRRPLSRKRFTLVSSSISRSHEDSGPSHLPPAFQLAPLRHRIGDFQLSAHR